VNRNGFYLADKETPIIDAIYTLHRSSPAALATAEQIHTFDVRQNIVEFLLEDKPRYWTTVM